MIRLAVVAWIALGLSVELNAHYARAEARLIAQHEAHAYRLARDLSVQAASYAQAERYFVHCLNDGIFPIGTKMFKCKAEETVLPVRDVAPDRRWYMVRQG